MKPLNRKRNENRVKGLWDNTNCTNIDIIGSPKEKWERKGQNIFEDIISENFPNLGKETSQTGSAQKTTHIVIVVQSLSHVRLSVTSWTAACQASLSFTVSQSWLKLMSTESVMPLNHLILCCPLLLLPTIFPRVFSSELALPNRWPKDWSFSIRPSNEYSWLISSRIDWFELFAVQGTLKSLLQHHNSKASILRCSAFFMVQLLHLYVTTGNTIALTRWIFVSEVMSLLFNTLSRFVVAFLPRSKCLNIVAAVTIHNDIGTHKNKIFHCLHFFQKLVERKKS